MDLKNRDIYLIIFIFFLILLSLFLNFFHFSIVVGNSMQPVLQPDDIILVDKGSDNVQEGQIIIFNHSIKDQYIVHRVIDKNKNGYITKGDNNQYRDDITVREENIYGKVVTKSTEQTINIIALPIICLIFIILLGFRINEIFIS